MRQMLSQLESRLQPEALAWWAQAQARAKDQGAKALPVLFPALARRLGKHAFQDSLDAHPAGDSSPRVDLSAWRVCDAAGWCLLDQVDPDPAVHLDLYQHGDFEERIIALRALALRPITQATVDLLHEVQRANIGVHIEAGALDSDVVVRAMAERAASSAAEEGFTPNDFCRLVLKLAFMDIPAARIFGGLEQATPELSQRLEDFAQEREAAGRTVWPDTYRFMGHAPSATSHERLRQAMASDRPEVVRAGIDGIRASGDAALMALLPATS